MSQKIAIASFEVLARTFPYAIFFHVDLQLHACIKCVMSLYRYFQHQGGLPSAKEMGQTPLATAESNKVVEKVILEAAHGPTRKRRYVTMYTDEDRAKIRRYAAENGNV